MESITINVEVPFKRCNICKQLDIDCDRYWGSDGIYYTRYYCPNEEMCENAKKIAEVEE